jgi:hypothetical protein
LFGDGIGCLHRKLVFEQTDRYNDGELGPLHFLQIVMNRK